MDQEELRQLLQFICADQLIKTFDHLVLSTCQCCTIDYPSQQQHSSYMDPGTRSDAELYNIAAAQLDKVRMKAIFAQASKMLWLNHLCIDFDDTICENLNYWEENDFEDIEKIHRDLGWYYGTPAKSAAVKIDSLTN